MTAFIRSSQGYLWGVGGENKVWLALGTNPMSKQRRMGWGVVGVESLSAR